MELIIVSSWKIGGRNRVKFAIITARDALPHTSENQYLHVLYMNEQITFVRNCHRSAHHHGYYEGILSSFIDINMARAVGKIHLSLLQVTDGRQKD